MNFNHQDRQCQHVILSAAKDLAAPDDSCVETGDPSRRSGWHECSKGWQTRYYWIWAL